MELWLAREHFDLLDPWEHVDFQVRSTFDVVAAAGWHFRRERQLVNELWLVREGSVHIRLGEREQTVHAPSLVLLGLASQRDTRHVDGPQLSILGFAFDATLWGALDFIAMLGLPISWPMDVTSFEPLLQRMVEETRHQRAGYSLATSALGALSVVELLRSRPQSGVDKGSELELLARHPELSSTLRLISARFGEPLDVAQLARAAHLSPKHFGKKFRAALGVPPMEFVRRFRLNRARDLLATNEDTAATIALRCGFDDAAHFSRAFKREFGATPGTFRRAVRETNAAFGPENRP
ncbi:HTH-type transcriptional activator Btr [Abditibacteriota bacterium]|nr:HTH-type transcriptional activator Btr [Abditibacteriota bacterium]